MSASTRVGGGDLDLQEETSSGSSSLETERHHHHLRRHRHVGLTVAPGITSSAVWSDLPSRISEGHYRIGTDNTLPRPSSFSATTRHEPAVNPSIPIGKSIYHRYSHPATSHPDNEHYYVHHGAMSPLMEHTGASIPPNWPYQVGPSSQPVLLRNFNSPFATSRQQYSPPSEMFQRKRSRLPWATYLILATFLISSLVAAFLFFTGQNYQKSSVLTSMATNSPTSNPILASTSRTSVNNTKQQNAPSSASYAYYYYYYPNQTLNSGINQSGETVTTFQWDTNIPSPSPNGFFTPTTFSNPMISPSTTKNNELQTIYPPSPPTALKNSTTASSPIIFTNDTHTNNSTMTTTSSTNVTLGLGGNTTTSSLKTNNKILNSTLTPIIDAGTKQSGNITNNATLSVQPAVGTSTTTDFLATSITPSNNDDPFPANSLNDDRIRTDDDVSKLLSSANDVEVNEITGTANTVDDTTNAVTTSSGNDKTDDDPIAMYPESAKRAGVNLTFQGYDDGFDDSVHDDAYPVDDAWGSKKQTKQVSTVVTGTTGTEFIPQQSTTTTNFDFGGKVDDFASTSSTKNDFESSVSDLNSNSGDDSLVGGSLKGGDDFQNTIDGISSAIMKFSQSSNASSNLMSDGIDQGNVNETLLTNYTGSITFTNVSMNQNITDVDKPSSQPTKLPTIAPWKGTIGASSTQPVSSSNPSISLTKKEKKDIKGALPQPIASSNPSFSPTDVNTPTQPEQSYQPSFLPTMDLKNGAESVPSLQPFLSSQRSISPTNAPVIVPNIPTGMGASSTQPVSSSNPSVSLTTKQKKDFKDASPSYQPSFSPTMDPKNLAESAPSLQTFLSSQRSISPTNAPMIVPNLPTGRSSMTRAPSSTKLAVTFSPVASPVRFSWEGYYYYYYYPPSSPTSHRRRNII